ncbi:MAG TPA: transcriptional activator NhaR [Thermoanaerobaculia bacterium]|jgi:LysR family transcriptional activator of nhaA
MDYRHLHYFWTVVREGGVTRAARRLNVTQPSISKQLRSLQQVLGAELFTKEGRQLRLTDTGRVVFEYADEIFALGRELQDAVGGRLVARQLRLAVGVADVVPKAIAYRLLAPALRIEDVQLVVEEDSPERLLARLPMHELDLVITDAPVAGTPRVFSRLLGESPVGFFAPRGMKLRGRFPAMLDGARMLVPTQGTELRRAIDHWLESAGLHPQIVGEFADSALMQAFAVEARAIVPAPAVVRNDITRQFNVRLLGTAATLRERYYAVTAQRRINHPALAAILTVRPLG